MVPNGKIIYSDVKETEKALFSPKLCLSGRPDYIIETKHHHIIPVEVKTGHHFSPKPWHIMQLISYCHLVSETYQQKTPYGILIYSESKKQFKINYTEEYHSLLCTTITTMYKHMKTRMVERNHTDPMKCMYCTMKSYCPEKLEMNEDNNDNEIINKNHLS